MNEVPEEIWDAVVEVATYQRTGSVAKRDPEIAWDICGLIEDVVRHIYPMIREEAA